MSKINKTCKLIAEKNSNCGSIKAKNVRIHKEKQIRESAITNLKFFNLFNIWKGHLIYTNII